MKEKFEKFLLGIDAVKAIIVICTFNVFDALLTIFWIEHGLA